jgi:cell wall-associated NlpC family hydrolase
MRLPAVLLFSFGLLLGTPRFGVAAPEVATPLSAAAATQAGAPATTAAMPAAPAAPASAPAAAVGTFNPGDVVLQLLQDKLLLPKPAQLTAQLDASPAVQQLRDRASEMVLSAMNFLGVRYRRGGNSAETGFDCSGFTRYVFEHSLGLVLPRRASEQATIAGLKDIKKDELRPGDLVFFNTMRKAFSHVGIYVGEGKFIHAPSAGSQVRVEDMRTSYWVQRFNGARRAEATAPPANPQARVQP